MTPVTHSISQIVELHVPDSWAPASVVKSPIVLMMAGIVKMILVYCIFRVVLRPSLAATSSFRIQQQKDSKKFVDNDGPPAGFIQDNYIQTLEHYQPTSNITFRQRYAINYRHWGGNKSKYPIVFLCSGDQLGLYGALHTAGFVFEMAKELQALILVIEHRYFGSSNPFGSWEEAYRNTTTLGYLNSNQAISDYVELIGDLKRRLHAENSPVIATGSFLWRNACRVAPFKVPHVVTGAWASSTPLRYLDNVTPDGSYHFIIRRDFCEASSSCCSTMKNSWSAIHNVSSQYDGLNMLSKIFHSYFPLRDVQALGDFLMQAYYIMALQISPRNSILERFCNIVDGAAKNRAIVIH